VSGSAADGSPRTTKNPYSLNWEVMREEFYTTKRAGLGATEGSATSRGRRPCQSSL